MFLGPSVVVLDGITDPDEMLEVYACMEALALSDYLLNQNIHIA